MKKIKKILAPTDLSELSKIGLRHALEMGASEGASVLVYHVIAPLQEWLARHDDFFFSAQELVEERKRMLAKFLKESFADLLSRGLVQQEVEVGVPHKRIVEKAEEESADLIVMSTHGRSGLLDMMVGSVTEKVVRGATCPVLSIRPAKAAGQMQTSAA